LNRATTKCCDTDFSDSANYLQISIGKKKNGARKLNRISGKCFQQLKYQALIDIVSMKKLLNRQQAQVKSSVNIFGGLKIIFHLRFRSKIYENRMSMISSRENKSEESMKKFEEIKLTSDRCC
jgi:hypothetical protein